MTHVSVRLVSLPALVLALSATQWLSATLWQSATLLSTGQRRQTSGASNHVVIIIWNEANG